MSEYKVVFEIEIDAEDEYEAAEKVQEELRDENIDWQFYVQKYNDNTVWSVDLQENTSRESKYIPLIR